jgi:tRNA nucleotidyltransferase (CCA-adding enzyme)
MKKNKTRTSTVITAHANADFDSLAAMVAAGKLYPGAVLVFPGSQEKNIKNFFIQSATYLYNFKSLRDVDLDSVTTMVVVDTRQYDRVRHMAPLLEKQDLIIHVYDHHPASDNDLPAEFEDIRPWGSATAILVDHIRKQEIPLSRDEATLLGLGIYEDTGCFTFSSTTEHDLGAAAWLRSCGMDLNIVADIVNRELTAEQVAVLNTLLESASTHTINGVEVVIAEVSLERYMGDFALLAHKLLDMENIRILFALARMGDRVQMVARSRSPHVDVGQICSTMGGGGHPYAASASIKDRTLAQVKEELFGLLYSVIASAEEVRALMSKPPLWVDVNQPMAWAAEHMTRFGLKAVPVLDGAGGKCVGIMEHQLAEKGVGHGLGNVPVREYMATEVSTVTPDDDLYMVMEIILGRRQRLVPVLEEQRLVGVMTRTDLINILVREPARIPETLLPGRKQERNVNALMRERLPREVYDLLRSCGTLAQDLGLEVFCVGGFVRDILLRIPNLDIDLVVEGDGIGYARALADMLGGRIRAHHKFKTAVVILPDGQKIDVATARLEYYEYPAALPTVELSSIKMDLYRRDFSINALAVQLNPGDFGRLVDFFGGQNDIKQRVIRVLHSLSFVEDPTRILRAIRFEQRYSFQIGGQTEKLIKNAVHLNIFHRLSGARVFQELKLLMNEADPLACLNRMKKFKLLGAIHPLLQYDPAKESILREIDKVLAWYKLLYLDPQPERWLIYFLGLCAGFDDSQVHILARRLVFPQRISNQLFAARSQVRQAVEDLHKWQQGDKLQSELYFILAPMSLEGVLYLMARSDKEFMRKSISQYLTQLRTMDISISGKDLQSLGLKPGPEYGRVLNRVLAARLDGQACDRETQMDWVRHFLKKQE